MVDDYESGFYDEPCKLTKSKMTKSIWIQIRDHYELWKVEKLIKPNKFQTYILLSFQDNDEDASYMKTENGYIKTTDMMIIEDGNDTWYNNTNEVQKIVKRINKLSASINVENEKLKRIGYNEYRKLHKNT